MFTQAIKEIQGARNDIQEFLTNAERTDRLRAAMAEIDRQAQSANRRHQKMITEGLGGCKCHYLM